MKANFDDPLQLKADGRWLEACGPLDWSSPDGPQNAHKVIVTVRISQNNVVAQGTSQDLVQSEQEWMVYVRPGPGQKFRGGPALAIGTLTVIETDPPLAGGTSHPETFSWQGSPNLQFSPS